MAVIAPTPGADGVLVERAKARRGLASVGDARSFRAGGLDECPGQGGDSGKVLNEVECRALGGQDGERATRDAGYLGAGGKLLPILGQLRHRERVIDAGEDRRTYAKAGQNQGFTRHQSGSSHRLWPDHRLRGDVASAQVLLQGELDQTTNCVGIEARI